MSGVQLKNDRFGQLMLHLSNKQQNKCEISNENKSGLGHIKATYNLSIQTSSNFIFIMEPINQFI